MIKRYFAKKDNTITNAFEENLSTRGTGSNMGASDILEVFSIYGQQDSGSSELARILIEFDVNQITADRASGAIPASGSVNFFLNMYDTPHSQTVPRDFTLTVSAISASWEEGYGIDMDFYEDITRDGFGSNWIQARQSSSADGGQWGSPGGDYHTDTSSSFTQQFSDGFENLSVDVTPLVEQWLNSAGNILGSKPNYGFGIQLSNSFETATKSFFTKKFFGRDTEFFVYRPTLEARFNDSKKDDRGNFYLSSSLAGADENLNTIYLYNYVRGRLRNIPSVGTGQIGVSLFSSSAGAPVGSAFNLVQDGTRVLANNRFAVTGGHVETGIYSASVAFTGSDSLGKIHDVWFELGSSDALSAHGSTQFTTGTIELKRFAAQPFTTTQNYVLSMPNLQQRYRQDETPKIELYVREKDWSPNIFTVATRTKIPSLLIESASYQIKRSIDDFVAVPYGTGSIKYTELSYDVSGNYFNLDTGVLEAGYNYNICFAFYNENSNTYVEQPYKFKFRVVNDEY